MDIDSLRKEIRKTGLDLEEVNIENKPYLEDHCNMIKSQNGKWEVFYGEHGQKRDLCIYETKEEAADALLKLVFRCYGIKESAHQSIFSWWRQRKSDNDPWHSS